MLRNIQKDLLLLTNKNINTEYLAKAKLKTVFDYPYSLYINTVYSFPSGFTHVKTRFAMRICQSETSEIIFSHVRKNFSSNQMIQR